MKRKIILQSTIYLFSAQNYDFFMFKNHNSAQKTSIYRRASMALTLVAHSPGLSRTVIMVPTDHFMPNPPWIAGATLG